MKILVTGSSGFIGFSLIKKLLKLNYKVVGVDNHNDYYDIKLKEARKEKLNSKNYIFYKQDINNIKIKENNFDLAIHLAAQAGVRVPKEKNYLYKESNIRGFESFCNFCKLKNIKRVIYASSSSVYSDSHTKKYSEHLTDILPKSIYGKSKKQNEIYASYFSKNSNISMIGLRFFSVYGPYGRPDMAYYSFTHALKNGNEIKLNNKGKMSRDMTYIDDITDGIIGAINYIFKKKNVMNNEIFNLGNDKPIETARLLKTIEKKINIKSKIKFVETNNEAFITHADISKAQNLLGYNPKVSFEDGIDKFLNWYKEYEQK